MSYIGCMVTGNTVEVDYGESPDESAIIVMRNGKVIGVVSSAAQEKVATLRMTFTREQATAQFVPLQGVAIQHFRTEHPDDSA